MLVIMTLNPSLDYYMKMENIRLGETNHSHTEHIQIGGKGINVAIMMNNLQRPSTLFGFQGGFTGQYLEDQLKNYEYINAQFIKSQAMTRINVKVSSNGETELNGSGDSIDSESLDKLDAMIDSLKSDDFVMISGRLAQGMPKEWYLDLAEKLSQKNIEYSVDITGKDVLKMCQHNPLILKPNLSELEDMFDIKIQTEEDIIVHGKKLISMGAKYCIVSLGKDGSLFFDKENVYQSNVPQGDVVNTVGAGDSMIAGFVNSYLKNKDALMAYKYAVACGSATTYSKGIASKDSVEKLLTLINIKKKGD